MRVLVATTVLPDPAQGGGEVVTTAFVRALRAAGHDVCVLGLVRPGAPASASVAGELRRVVGERAIETATASPLVRARWLAGALLRREPFSVAKYRSRPPLDAARPWDLAVVDHLQMAWLAPRLGRPLVLIDHNHEADVYAQQARTASGPGRWLWSREHRRIGALERRAVAAADEVWVLTRSDAAALSGDARRIRVFAVPGVEPPARQERAGDHVAVLGTWTWGPNREGLRWLLDEVVPRLGGTPEVVVGGRGAEALGAPPPGSRFAGRVPDAATFLGQAAAIAVPAVAGSGVQVKTLDAIASGAPVVTTTVGLRGIDDAPPSVRVADDPEGFAAALRAAVDAPRTEDGIAWARERAERFATGVRTALLGLR